MTPAWILDIFAALMLAVAAVSAARIVAARPWQRGAVVTDTDIAYLLMAIAMAGMPASSLTTLPNVTWEVIFAMMTAWFAGRVVRDARANGVRALAGGRCVPHLTHSAAMLYMFLALAAPAAGGGSAMPTLHYPTVAFVFALIVVGYRVWDLDWLSSTAPVAVVPAAALAGVPDMASADAVTVAFSGSAAEAGARTDLRSRLAEADQVVAGGGGSDRSGARHALLSPGTTVGCWIVTGVTMALLLLIMI